MDWQTIETAPKDGNPILCAKDGMIFIVRWWTLDDGGWSLDLGGNDECLVLNERDSPTHWMPLPKPPFHSA